MYGKLIDGKLIKAKHFIIDGKATIINPTDEMYEEHGYKKVRETEAPDISEGQILKVRYEESENEIRKCYEVEDAEM